MRTRVLPTLLAALVAATATACGSSIPSPEETAIPTAAAAPVVDEGRPTPAEIAVQHVPDDVSAIAVTDFDAVALDLGITKLSSDLTPAARASFWKRAQTQTAMLSSGVLRPAETQLLSQFSFGQEDVGWEALLYDDAGKQVGWILGLHAIIDPQAVEKAVKAGVGPLKGARVDAADGLVLSGEAGDGSSTWSGPATLALLGDGAVSTYVEQGCVPSSDDSGLLPLDAYSMSFQTELATARLGADRTDVFTRLQLTDDTPGIGGALRDGVADPRSGRLGFQIVDPGDAATLTLRRRLGFTACG
ncbi:hypothetical protein [Nocardioides acrostichi]|uniref:Lipoprotein n=1 Tax=Nocardioides acrostichi TaxID=2784339 RepID=A0A930Y9A0_9ACTN|nr:hypothetical protein [Nocardioides acrostichi]MBF4163957.1 hypothetical protein [Nocardioides acrostichi]